MLSTSLNWRIGYLIKRVQSALRLELDRALASEGLTTPQYAVLSALEEAAGQSNADLARLSFVTPQTMIQILAGLEAKGLVQRRSHASHGRIREAELTAEGRHAVKSCHGRVLAVVRRMARPLSAGERQHLAGLLERCAVALEKSGGAA